MNISFLHIKFSLLLSLFISVSWSLFSPPAALVLKVGYKDGVGRAARLLEKSRKTLRVCAVFDLIKQKVEAVWAHLQDERSTVSEDDDAGKLGDWPLGRLARIIWTSLSLVTSPIAAAAVAGPCTESQTLRLCPTGDRERWMKNHWPQQPWEVMSSERRRKKEVVY